MAFKINSTDLTCSRVEPINWELVFTELLPCIYNFFLYKTGEREQAQDLTASTFERAWRLRRRYRPPSASPSTWLFGIARNVFKEHLRRHKNMAKNTAGELPRQLPSDVDVEEDVLKQHDREHLRTIIRSLSEREQDLVAMKYGAGLTNREIARIMKLSETNVGSILHRTVKKLREKWGEFHGR
jgi:RNA polymerase sigma factor (sigma-70 family)